MELLKANLEYKIPQWITNCSECKSELKFSRKDTVLYVHSIGGKREFFIQCPYCGRWQLTQLDR